MNKYNNFNTNIAIKHYILNDDDMRAAGFDRKTSDQSWLLVESLPTGAELWFEIWGEGDNEFCIESVNAVSMVPKMNIRIRRAINKKMLELQARGIVSNFNPKMPIFRRIM